MKNQIILFLAILIAWITLGALLYEDKCCQDKPFVKTSLKPGRAYFHGIQLNDQEDFHIYLRDNFIFYRSTSGYLLPLSDSLKNTIQLTSDYIKRNPNKKLKLICRYNPLESHKKNTEDWGILRAKEVEKVFIAQGVPQDQIIVASLVDSLLPIINNRIYGGFIPLILNK
ncbi:MAG: hypothetical protein ABI851_06705 [Saprospiraceae bacterium]